MKTDPRMDATLRAAFEALSRNAAFDTNCPPPEQLWSGARGELAPSHVQSLALHVAECGACAEAWRIARDFGTPAEFATPVRGVQWWMPAAAVIVLASAVSLFYLTRPAGVTLAPTTAVVTPPPPVPLTIPVDKAPIKVSSRYALTWRGPDDGRIFLAALKRALEPYERGDYPAAVASLAQLSANYRDTTEPAFYLGVSQLMTGAATAAIEQLEHARDLADPEQLEDATWYLAAAYERAGRRADAARAAQLVCDGTGPRSASACTAAARLQQP